MLLSLEKGSTLSFTKWNEEEVAALIRPPHQSFLPLFSLTLSISNQALPSSSLNPPPLPENYLNSRQIRGIVDILHLHSQHSISRQSILQSIQITNILVKVNWQQTKTSSDVIAPAGYCTQWQRRIRRSNGRWSWIGSVDCRFQSASVCPNARQNREITPIAQVRAFHLFHPNAIKKRSSYWYSNYF